MGGGEKAEKVDTLMWELIINIPRTQGGKHENEGDLNNSYNCLPDVLLNNIVPYGC